MPKKFRKWLKEKIWKDPVWSKVISNGIWTIIVSMPLSLGWINRNHILMTIKKINWNFIKYLILNYWYLFIITTLILVIAKLLSIINKNNSNGLRWIKSVNHKELIEKYFMLFWFPLNNTLVAKIDADKSKMQHNISFMDTPIFKDLIDHQIIKVKGLGRIGWLSFEIDSQVYRYIEKRANQIPKAFITIYKENSFNNFFDEDFISLAMENL
jgi:hypothetical protein